MAHRGKTKIAFAPLAPGVRDPQFESPSRKKLLLSDEEKARSKTRVRVSIVRCSVGRLDVDNCFGSVKYICDALRYAGIIRDDDPDSMELHVTQRKVKRADIGTEILIEDLT